jgi:2'-5' RNA ligase
MRRRLGVALMLPEPVRQEVDGLRRACGDPTLGRVPPHVTLVPPVNVAEAALDHVGRLLRSAAATVRTPLSLALGPAATFAPVSPVAYLAVGGAHLELLRALHQRLAVAPLRRDTRWEYVPHVTLRPDGDEARLAAVVAALADYRVEVEVYRVHLLEEQRDPDGVRRWRPIDEVAFGRPTVAGIGGVEVRIDVGTTAPPARRRRRTAVARCGDEVVGWAGAGMVDGRWVLVEWFVEPGHRGLGIGERLGRAVVEPDRETPGS